jgi:competence protein ComEC
MQLARLLRVLLVLVATAAISLHAQTADHVVPTDEVKTRVVVRENASGTSDDRGSLRPGQSAELLGSVPNWYRVRLANGVEGFVSKRWTRIVSAGAPTPAGGPSFTVDVVDVGTGLGVLVRGPDFTLVYDAGSNDDQALGDDNRMLAFIREVAPTLTIIDHVVLSHPHTDHVLLLPDLFANYEVRHVWDSGRVNDICGYRAFIEAIRTEPGVAYHTAVQNGGTRSYTFTEKQCGSGAKLPQVILPVSLSTIIDNAPVQLGQAASMTILHADGGNHGSFNENSLVVRLDLGTRRILLMGDAEAGGRHSPSVLPASSSVEGKLLACCLQGIAADVLIVGHHGSRTSLRTAFLDGVMASTFVVSSGPTKYQTVVLPDGDVIAELGLRGQLFRTDVNDAACRTATNKIGPDSDDRPGGCTNIRVSVSPTGVSTAFVGGPN